MNKLLYTLPVIVALILIPLVTAAPSNCNDKNPTSMAYLLCKDQIIDSKMSAQDKKIAHLESIVFPNNTVTAEGDFSNVVYNPNTKEVTVEGEIIKHSSFSQIMMYVYDQNNKHKYSYNIDNGPYLGVIGFKEMILHTKWDNSTSFKLDLIDHNNSKSIVLDSTIVSLLP